MSLNLSRIVLLVALIHFCTVWASAAVQSSAENICDSSEGKCSSKEGPGQSRTIADDVLDEAARVQEMTAEKVVEDDATVRTDHGDEHVPGKNGDSFENVWNSAYRQWIAADGASRETVKGLNPATKRAIEEVQRRKGGSAQNGDNWTSPEQKKMSDLEDSMGESEVVVLEKAVLRLLTDSPGDLLKDLDLIEYLCHSGDNGNHLESIGGVGILLNVTQSEAHQAAHVLAVKALATCAQNNPTVFNRAAADGAVGTLLGLADETDSAAMRASALRALISLRDGEIAQNALLKEEERLFRVIKRSVDIGMGGKDERRSVLRALALVEPLLKSDASRWLPAAQNAGIIEWCSGATSHTDADVRETAARVLKASENKAAN